jgi:hypothetical protein
MTASFRRGTGAAQGSLSTVDKLYIDEQTGFDAGMDYDSTLGGPEISVSAGSTRNWVGYVRIAMLEDL